MKPRILVADPQPLVAEALACLLEPAFEVVGRLSEGTRLVEEASRLRPALVLTDVWLYGLDGLGAARRLRDEAPGTRVVFLTAEEDLRLVAEAFRAGARGYVLRRSRSSELGRALQAALRGDTWLSPVLAGGDPGALPDPTRVRGRSRTLTPRRREVVRLLAGGHSMKEAAAALGISLRTIAYHKYEAMRSLDIRSSAQLVRFAVESHLLPGQLRRPSRGSARAESPLRG